MAKSRAEYSVYERWYEKYASTTQMKEGKLTEREYNYFYRLAKASKRNMKDFSRTIAMKQKMASELQMRATWAATKQSAREFKKDIREAKKSVLDDILESKIRQQKGKRRIGKKAIKEEIRKWKKRGIPKEYREEADRIVSERMREKIHFLENYEELTWREFRMDQKRIVRLAREASDRETWDEAFKIAFDSPKENAA